MRSSDFHGPDSSTDTLPSAQPENGSTSDWAEIRTCDAAPAGPIDPGASTDPVAATDPAATPPARISDTRYIQHYELIRELGRGGMGLVHLARDLRLGRLVAIKVLARPGPAQERFLAEARATARCRHENIVVIHEVGVHDEQPYLVFEYLRGQTLRHWMDARLGGAFEVHDSSGAFAQMPAPLAPTRAVEMIVPVVRALVCAHDMGIIHRDLKPANILLTDEGVTKVLDFGVAKIGAVRASIRLEDAGVSEAPLNLTALGARLGTLPYMSPEQLSGKAVDHRSDIWAVGIILYELVTDAHPLAPLSPAKIHAMADAATLMPDVREHRSDLGPLADVISRCLLKDREHRTATARELLQELERLLPAQRTRARDEGSNPFAGLAAFQEADADRFFGRDHDVTSLASKLRGLPLATVTGPSGAGKSSLVRAGVIPALKRSGEGWEAIVTRPGRQPLAALAEVLLALSGRSSDPLPGHGIGRGVHEVPAERDAIIARLRAEPGYLGIALRTWARAKLRRLVLFVDQFEELYTLGADSEERACVLACLSAVADDMASPLRVILSVRSDFLDRLVEQRAFLDAVSHGLTFLSPLDRGSLREALTRPLEACDHGFESRYMVERILDELEATRSPLPLLQFTADKLWARRDRRRRVLTESSLRALGGVSGALAGHADAILASMPAQDARLARAVFLRLVTPERTRALATLAELRQLDRDAESMSRVLARLIDARLIAVEGSSESAAGGESDGLVEIVHESLIDTWPLLARWLAENEKDALFLARLRSAARDWQRSGHAPGLLWTGEAASDARTWHQRYQGALAPGEEGFLVAISGEVGRQHRRRRRFRAGMFTAITSVAIITSYLAWQAVTAAAQADRAASAARQVANFLVELFEVADPYKAAGNQITARQILDRGAARIETELRDQPAIRARLMHIMGVVYGNLGLYPEATSLLEQALATRRQLNGRDHLDAAETEDALADVLVDTYEFVRAEELYRQALGTRRGLLGEEHPLVADSMHGLALALSNQRESEEARDLAENALRLRRKLLGESHPDVAASLQTLGSVHMIEGGFGGAEAALREATDMYRRLLGDDALEVAEATHLLARVHLLQKEYDAAEKLLEQSLAIKQRALGESHVSLADGLANLADIARQRGDLQRAEALFQKALGIYRASLEGDRVPMVYILWSLEQLTGARGDFAGAEALAREAVAVARQVGSDERLIATLLTDLAFALQLQGEHQEAEDAFRQSLAIHERTRGDAAVETIEARANLAAVLLDAGDVGDATVLLEQARSAGTNGDAGWLSHHVDSVRGAYLARTGQSAQAEELLQRSHAALQAQLGAQDRHTLMAARRLVWFYENIGMPEKAREYRVRSPGNGGVTP